MRLIDVDALPKLIILYQPSDEVKEIINVFTKAIAEAPTIDAVRVVRCKDCQYRDADDFCMGRGYPNMLVPDDGFCEKGARREE